MNKKTGLYGLGAIAIAFAVVNVLDLILTMKYFMYESNPLVIAYPATFYLVKLSTTFLILTIGLFLLFNCWGMNENG